MHFVKIFPTTTRKLQRSHKWYLRHIRLPLCLYPSLPLGLLVMTSNLSPTLEVRCLAFAMNDDQIGYIYYTKETKVTFDFWICASLLIGCDRWHIPKIFAHKSEKNRPRPLHTIKYENLIFFTPDTYLTEFCWAFKFSASLWWILLMMPY